MTLYDTHNIYCIFIGCKIATTHDRTTVSCYTTSTHFLLYHNSLSFYCYRIPMGSKQGISKMFCGLYIFIVLSSLDEFKFHGYGQKLHVCAISPEEQFHLMIWVYLNRISNVVSSLSLRSPHLSVSCSKRAEIDPTVGKSSLQSRSFHTL